MHKRLSVLIIMIAFIAGLLAVPAAQAAPTPPPPTPPPPTKPATPQNFSPKTGVVFNQPFGTKAQQTPIIDQVAKSIDSVPKGSKIRIAVYSWFLPDVTDKIIAARNRGVTVRMIISDHVWNEPEVKRLRNKLGTNKSKDNFIYHCKGSCMSSKESMMHAKLYLFSTAGSSKLVSMIGSSNIAESATTGSWNNLYTIANDEKMYNANLQYFNDMLKNKSWKNYYRTAESGPNKLYFYPKAYTKKDPDTMLTVLNGVKCTGAAAGYGDGKGHTVVRVAMYAWTYGRAALARRLVTLMKQGCKVEVIYSGERIEKKVTEILVAKSNGRQIPVYNGRANYNVGTTYMHHKVVMIDGVYYGNKANRAIYTGSANFTSNTQRECNEIMIRIGITQANYVVWQQFTANLNLIRGSYSKRVTTAKGAMHQQNLKTRSTATDDFFQMVD